MGIIKTIKNLGKINRIIQEIEKHENTIISFFQKFREIYKELGELKQVITEIKDKLK